MLLFYVIGRHSIHHGVSIRTKMVTLGMDSCSFSLGKPREKLHKSIHLVSTVDPLYPYIFFTFDLNTIRLSVIFINLKNANDLVWCKWISSSCHEMNVLMVRLSSTAIKLSFAEARWLYNSNCIMETWKWLHLCCFDVCEISKYGKQFISQPAGKCALCRLH